MAAENDIDQIVLKQFFAGKAGMFRPGGLFGRKRTIIDVGAAQPEYLSISAGFRREGWKVIAVEPNPTFCAAHRAKGYKIHQYACSDRDQDNVDFTLVDSHGAGYHGGEVSNESFSSLGIDGNFAELYEGARDRTSISHIHVNVRKLDTILREHESAVKRVDILAVDVEGWEIKVVDGFSLENYRPKVVILENLFSDEAYYHAMESRGYKFWRNIEPNDIYVRAEGRQKARPSNGGRPG